MERISQFIPPWRGLPRVDERQVLSGIIYVIRNCVQWSVAPKAYGPYQTLYKRFLRWVRAVIK